MSDTTSQSTQNQSNVPVSFAQFIVSLGSSALVHLGELQDPANGGTAVNLPLARHTIAVLDLLTVKTAGNLEGDESRLLSALLDDLHKKLDAVAPA